MLYVWSISCKISMASFRSYYLSIMPVNFILNTPIPIQWLAWSLIRFYDYYFFIIVIVSIVVMIIIIIIVVVLIIIIIIINIIIIIII